MSKDNAAEAREGLLDNLAGKAKEVAGAVTGKDDLVQEGQLQQEEARNRKEAVAEEAIAEAKRKEATDDYRDETREAAQLKDQARAEADQHESAADRQQAEEERAAEREAALRKAAGQDAAEDRAADLEETRLREAEKLEADAEVSRLRADAETTSLENEAAAAERQAAQLRNEANK